MFNEINFSLGKSFLINSHEKNQLNLKGVKFKQIFHHLLCNITAIYTEKEENPWKSDKL